MKRLFASLGAAVALFGAPLSYAQQTQVRDKAAHAEIDRCLGEYQAAKAGTPEQQAAKDCLLEYNIVVVEGSMPIPADDSQQYVNEYAHDVAHLIEGAKFDLTILGFAKQQLELEAIRQKIKTTTDSGLAAEERSLNDCREEKADRLASIDERIKGLMSLEKSLETVYPDLSANNPVYATAKQRRLNELPAVRKQVVEYDCSLPAAPAPTQTP